MSQATNPHPQLVAVRNRIQACGWSRKQAAALCGEFSDAQCEAVLAAKVDADVEKALQPAKSTIEKAAEQAAAKSPEAAAPVEMVKPPAPPAPNPPPEEPKATK